MIGHIDEVSGGRLHGWFGGDPDAALIVEADGRFIGIARERRARPDVTDAGGPGGDCGFAFPLPPEICDGRERTLTVRGGVDGQMRRIGRRIVLPDAGAAGGPHRRTGRAAVVCWDLAHNPAGRALVLVEVLRRIYAEVDLIGPLWPRFGDRIWPPLDGIEGFERIAAPVTGFADLAALGDRAASRAYDHVHICKPRWPGMYLGWRIVEASGCTAALDVDDRETAFFPDPGTAASPDPGWVRRQIVADRLVPFEGEATLACERLIEAFSLRTVSNPALAARFGGHLLRHARDHTTFDPARINRAAVRRQLGYGADERVILFAGTIRRHKGVGEIARAIAGLERDDLRLCLIGPVEDAALARELKSLLGSRLRHAPGVPFRKLPAVVAAADLVCLPQDASAAPAAFQVPAKLTDALAMGVPAIVEDLPPLADLGHLPGVIRRGTTPLADRIAEVLDDPPDRRAVRDGFLAEFSTLAVADRLSGAMRTAPAAGPDQRDRLGLALLGRAGHGPAARLSAPEVLRRPGRDIVFLWKQNDSALFGRRSDMLVKYLPRVGAAGRILQFDASVTLDTLEAMATAAANPLRMDGMVHRNVLARWLGLSDDLFTRRFTFVTDRHGRSLLGRTLPPPEDLPQLYADAFRRQGLSAEAWIWICPVALDAGAALSAHPFVNVACDLIDDQRAFAGAAELHAAMERNYALAIDRAGVLLANCAGVADSFAPLAGERPLHVVANAAEPLSPAAIPAVDLFPGQPVVRIGYLGNMRDRFDIDLVETLARADPRYRLILVGATGGNAEVEALGRLRNVTLTGPLPYDEANRLAAAFDIAILPHLDTPLTRTMNPLKLPLYSALGLPVVSTAVANLGGPHPALTVAADTESFLAAVARLAEHPAAVARAAPPDGGAPPATWESTAARVGAILDAAERGAARPATETVAGVATGGAPAPASARCEDPADGPPPATAPTPAPGAARPAADPLDAVRGGKG